MDVLKKLLVDISTRAFDRFVRNLAMDPIKPLNITQAVKLIGRGSSHIF